MGNDYGYEDTEGISPTEREFDRAGAAGKERLISVKGSKDFARHPKMQAFVRKAADQLVRRRFAEIAGLIAVVYASLVEHLQRANIIQNRPFDQQPCLDATFDDIDRQVLPTSFALPVPSGDFSCRRRRQSLIICSRQILTSAANNREIQSWLPINSG